MKVLRSVRDTPNDASKFLISYTFEYLKNQTRAAP